MPHTASSGALVSVRDEQWRVLRVETFERCSVVTLEGAKRRRLRIIEPFDRVAAVEKARVVRRRRQAVMQAALSAACAERMPLSLWTAAAASIDLLPYQLEPALAVLRGATRLLLADAVGLGKTIQAGLILSELRERGLVDRALVLCPPGLRLGWARELEQRFGIASTIFEPIAIAERAATLPAGVNPWTVHATVVASIDFVKRPEVLAAATAAPFDLVIADEAHHLTPGTDRGEAVHRLASQSPWCVMVTATPHSGDAPAFEYLTGIGGQGESLTIFRRSRRDAGLPSSRRERVVRMRPAAAETALLGAVGDYTRAIWHGRGAIDASVRLVATTIARRAASSPLALRRTLQRRLTLLSKVAEPVQARLPWDEGDDADGDTAADLLARPGLESEAAERDAIEHLLLLARSCEGVSKFEWLLRALRRFGEPAIVFTEFRDTLDALRWAVPSTVRVVSICGATPVDLRRAAVDAFNRGDADLLIATDTAGEGLNLHHRCRLVIDVELPWNPMRLEQRLGRVDRLGQRRRVHALRLFHPGTVEERVLECLELRRSRARWIDQLHSIDERAVAAAVFGASTGLPAAVPRISSTTIDEAAAEHGRIVRQRASFRARGPAPVGSPPRRASTARMLTLHTIACVNDAGTMLAERAIAHASLVDASQLGSRSNAIEATVHSPALEQALRAQSLALCASTLDALKPLQAAVTARIDAIQTRLTGNSSFQPALFDGRAAAAAAAREHTRQELDSALQRRRRSVDAPLIADAVSARLVAVWPERR